MPALPGVVAAVVDPPGTFLSPPPDDDDVEEEDEFGSPKDLPFPWLARLSVFETAWIV